MENEFWIMNIYGMSFWIIGLLVLILILTVIGLIIWAFRSSRQIKAIEKISEDIDKEILEKDIERCLSKDEQLEYIEKKLKGVEETLSKVKTDIEDTFCEKNSCEMPCMEDHQTKDAALKKSMEKTADIVGEILNTTDNNRESMSVFAMDNNSERINKAKGKSGKIYTESEIDKLIMS